MCWKTLFSFPFSVAPDAIYSHVKTRKEEARNMHYIAPEYAGYIKELCFGDITEFCCLIKVALKPHMRKKNGDGWKLDEMRRKRLENRVQSNFIWTLQTISLFKVIFLWRLL